MHGTGRQLLCTVHPGPFVTVMSCLLSLLQLRQFQEAKRAAATAGAASGDKTTPSAKDPSPPPAPAPAPLVQVEDASPAPSAPPAASFFVGGDDQDKSTSPSPAPPPPATLGEYFQQQAAAGAAPFGASSVMDSFSSSTAEGDASSASMQVHVGGNSSSGLANEHWSNISLMSRSEVPLGPPSSAFQQVDSFASTTTVPTPAAAVSDSVSRLTEEIGNVLAASSSAAGAEVTSMSAAEMGEEELLRRARTKQMEERNAELEEEVRRQHADLQMMEAQNGTLVGITLKSYGIRFFIIFISPCLRAPNSAASSKLWLTRGPRTRTNSRARSPLSGISFKLTRSQSGS